jgi:hypothetical protein
MITNSKWFDGFIGGLLITGILYMLFQSFLLPLGEKIALLGYFIMPLLLIFSFLIYSLKNKNDNK